MDGLGLAAVIAVVVGGVAFGFAGFAFALLATAGLALAWPPQVVIPAVMLVADTLTLPLLWEHRRYLRREVLRNAPPVAPWSPLFILLGVTAGALSLGALPPAAGRLALATVILVFIGFQVRGSAVAPAGAPHAASAWPARLAALAAGFVDGWISTGGVVVAVYLTWRRFAPGFFVTAMLVYFLATDLMRVVVYGALGYWTTGVFALYARVLPLALLGYLAGVLLRRVTLSPVLFRRVVLLLLAAYAVALVLRALPAR